MNSLTLDPCPFCGSKEVQLVKITKMPYEMSRYWKGIPLKVECCSCGASSSVCETAHDALARWNTRNNLGGMRLDNNGREICKGDWVEYGGRCSRVSIVGEGAYAILSDGTVATNLSHCTLCPLAYDKEPLLIDETVYNRHTGTPYKVAGFSKLSSESECDVVVGVEGTHIKQSIAPFDLVHRYVDSWKKLEQDSTLKPKDYLKQRRIKASSESKQAAMIADLVARAKKLANDK